MTGTQLLDLPDHIVGKLQKPLGGFGDQPPNLLGLQIADLHVLAVVEEQHEVLFLQRLHLLCPGKYEEQLPVLLDQRLELPRHVVVPDEVRQHLVFVEQDHETRRRNRLEDHAGVTLEERQVGVAAWQVRRHGHAPGPDRAHDGLQQRAQKVRKRPARHSLQVHIGDDVAVAKFAVPETVEQRRLAGAAGTVDDDARDAAALAKCIPDLSERFLSTEEPALPIDHGPGHVRVQGPLRRCGCGSGCGPEPPRELRGLLENSVDLIADHQ